LANNQHLSAKSALISVNKLWILSDVPEADLCGLELIYADIS